MRLYENALLNTYLLTPPRIYQWERLVLNPAYDGEDFMAYGYDNYGMRLCGERVGCCLSTDKRTNGAVAVFLCLEWHKNFQKFWMMIFILYLQAFTKR